MALEAKGCGVAKESNAMRHSKNEPYVEEPNWACRRLRAGIGVRGVIPSG
jgi:hypothetical protein